MGTTQASTAHKTATSKVKPSSTQKQAPLKPAPHQDPKKAKTIEKAKATKNTCKTATKGKWQASDDDVIDIDDFADELQCSPRKWQWVMLLNDYDEEVDVGEGDLDVDDKEEQDSDEEGPDDDNVSSTIN